MTEREWTARLRRFVEYERELGHSYVDGSLSLDDLERLISDAERLDWWESQRTYTLAPVMDAQGWRLHLPDVLRPLNVPFNRTLRAAIDEIRIRPPAEYVQDFGGTVECVNPTLPPNGAS